MMMMLVRHEREDGKENDGSARRALLIFVPCLPYYGVYLIYRHLRHTSPGKVAPPPMRALQPMCSHTL